MTAQELTNFAKSFLKLKGMRINRVNNIPVKRRKNTVEKGWADLQGYTDNGLYIACEIKTINDKLSIEQKFRLLDIKQCGGLAFICTEINGNPVIIDIGEFT